MKEAAARVKINKLLEAAGWRFFADKSGPANIQLESNVSLKPDDLDSFGENFEKTKVGYIDFLLLNEKGYPLLVLEAKSEDKNPLVGKEQARKYARSKNCRFIILSNGNLHYFWDLERRFFSPATTAHFSLKDFKAVPATYRTLIPQYIKDNVPLNQFLP